jgi:type IV pilus assembly protein PilX
MFNPSRSVSVRRRQGGLALVFVLVMMTIATSVAILTARITLLGERSSRNDRDRQVAFQAAEMALNDAELDIMDPATTRGCKFGTADLIPNEGCSVGGFCGIKPSLLNTPIYQDVNWDDESADRVYARYGEFTDRQDSLHAGIAGGPAVLPKYIIVQTTMPAVVPYDGGNREYETTSAYRVYALGYGVSKDTQVLLEGVIIKPSLSSRCITGGALS